MKYCILILCCVLFWGAGPVLAQDGCGCGEDDESILEEGPGCESDEEEERAAPPPKEEEKQPPPQRKVERPLQEQINEAIDNGIKFLKSKQAGDGSWGPCQSSSTYGQPGSTGNKCYFTGPTSFAVFTLAKCGANKKDKTVKRGLKWLRKKARHGKSQTTRGSAYRYSSYESASIVLMLEALNRRSPKRGKKKTERKITDTPEKPPRGSRFAKDDWKWMHERIQHILLCQNDKGGMRYWTRSRDKDLSATQFSLLAMRAASRAGYPINKKHWLWATSYVRNLADPKGSFPYQARDDPDLGMTAAGIACMVIGREQLELAESHVPSWIDTYVTRSFKYLGENFDLTKKQGGRWHYRYYYLYGIERIGDLTGRKEIGGKDWYVRGAKVLLEEQIKGGGWTDRSCMDPEDTLGTCFALLFLKKATLPAVTLTED